jgi:hypothetical protein
VAIKNPRYKSVEAILKSGLDKVALTEEVESRPVVHANIRGGAYFDRGEVESSGESNAVSDEIEAMYLEEERIAIINEPRIDPEQWRRHRVPAEGRTEVLNEASLGAMRAEPSRALMNPWEALLGRLQAVWTRPPEAPRSGERSANERGGNHTRYDQWVDLSCASQGACIESVCIEQEPSQRERMCEEMTCESEDACGDRAGRRRGEV